MSRWWIAATAAVAGLAIGLVVALVSPHDHRAESVVRFSGPGVDALLPDLRALATSSVLAGNVTSTLRLSESPDAVRNRLSASVRRGTRLVAIHARASTADKARQLAQEAAVVLTQIAPGRFASVRAQVFDPGHGIGGGNRHWFRDLGLGLLGGLCLGLFAAAVRAGGEEVVRPSVPTGDEQRDQLLARRTELVGRREAAVARRVGELAAREQALDRREEELERRRAQQQPPPPSPPEPVPAPVAQPGPPTEQAPVPVDGALTLNELERRVAAADSAPPAQREEWQNYLFLLRDHADSSGRLPSGFDTLIDEVFGELLKG